MARALPVRHNERVRHLLVAFAFAVGCSDPPPSQPQPDGGPAPPAPPGTEDPTTPDARPDGDSGAAPAKSGIAARYPGDVGIGADPDVVFHDGFEDPSIQAVVARYDDAKPGGLSLVADVPPKSPGKASVRMYADPSNSAADLYKQLPPGHDELWIRYYAKYEGGARWHHTGVWVGGYHPPARFPNPKAGQRPSGDDRFSVSVEPVEGSGSPNPRLDMYNYWMKMRSWMAEPSGDAAYFGNTLIHKKSLTVRDDAWMCIELHIKLNTDPASAAGAELELFVDGERAARFGDEAPLGCWVRDKFCAEGADTSGCTDYPDLCQKPLVPLDLQLRSTPDLKLNTFWPQNYISEGTGGSFHLDDVVIAKSYVGCIH